MGNPVRYMDPSGERFDEDFEVFKNDDGSYSLYDNKRTNPDSVFREQLLVVNASETSWKFTEDSISVCNVDVTLMTGGWEYENVDISLFDVGNLSVGFEANKHNFEAKAMVSAASPNVTFRIFGYEVDLSLEIGAVGGKLEIGSKGFSVGVAGGAGFSLSVSKK